MPDLDALNDPELLTDTPIGDLEVRMWGGEASVFVADRHDEERFGRCIHTLDKRGVLAALYGKRFWEQKAVQALYDRLGEQRTASKASAHADRRADFRRDAARILRREDGADTFVQVFGR